MYKAAIFLIAGCLLAGVASAEIEGNPDAFGPSQTEQTPDAQTLGQPPASANQNNQMMEKCKVVDSNGNGLIKPYMADSGINLEGDASAWIWVPRGQCAKINAGDFNGVSPDIMAKINTSNIQQAPTLGQ